MRRITVRSEDRDLVPAVLESYCCVDDEPFRAADSEVRVEEDDVVLGGWHLRYYYLRLRGIK
jgi:hypothetical protein